MCQSLGHAVLASILFNHAKSVDLKSKASITSFYMFIWKVITHCLSFFLVGPAVYHLSFIIKAVINKMAI